MSHNDQHLLLYFSCGFIVLLSHCLFLQLSSLLVFIVVAAVLPLLCNTPGCLLLVENFSESAVLNLFNPDNKNILIAHIVAQSNHVHCCVSEAKQQSHKGHRHHSSYRKYTFSCIVLSLQFF